jgi:signal transduction histidine kinase
MSSKLPHSRSAVLRIAALAGLGVAIVIAGSLGMLYYTASAVDRIQVREERALVSSYIEHNRREVVRDVVSASLWDAAYEKLGPDFDYAWADINIGAYYSGHLGHDITLVLDDRDRLVYAWRGNGRESPEEAGVFLREAVPLVRREREQERLLRRGGGAERAIGLGGVVSQSGVLFSQGSFYLVAASNVARETTAARQRPGRPYIIVSAVRIDADFLKLMADDLRVGAPHLALRRTEGAAAVSLLDVNGFVVGDLAWTAKRPGVTVIQDALPLFGLAVAMFLVVGLALTARIRAVFREIAANDRTLDRAMEELVRARDQANAANIAKSQFLANMSHEIRTPLNGILGMTQVMARENLDARQRERLDVVRDSGQTLLTVLNDILDISKIEAGKLEIDNHEFDMTAAVHAACNAFASLADQKDVAFRVEIAEEARGVWFGDGARLRQVISNLASNAVKFTRVGEVAVAVTRHAGGATFTVRDTGIGIPLERLNDLFQKFNQVDASTTRRFGGTGLGLAISRELVELMGGAMVLTSREGEGSTFTFDLPLTWRAAPRVDVNTAPPTHACGDAAGTIRILAAEDNPTNQLILKALLEPYGVDLILTANGREAVEAFGAGGFDLVLMDVQMPLMNGVEATTAIRRLEGERGLAAIPILALSANVMSHQVAEYLAAGMTGFIPKPIEAAKFFAAMEAALAPDSNLQDAAA